MGRGMAGDGHRPGLVPARDSSARRASTGTRSGTGLAWHDGQRPGLVLARDSAHADGHPAQRAIGLVRHHGHPAQRAIGLVRHHGHSAQRACGLVRPVFGMGVRDRRFSRAPLPMSGDRCATVAVRHGRHGSPVFPRIDTHEGRSVRDSPCPAWASWIAGFPAHRYP